MAQSSNINIVHFLFCLYILRNDVHTQWVIDDQGCRTPDGGVGNCISIKECKSIIDFLQNAPRPLSEIVKKKINSYSCGYEGRNVKVCCPSTPVTINNENLQVTDNYSAPPDVSRHKNLNALPKNCGYLPIDDKIRNGNDASLNEFPWMAILSYRTKNGPQFRCGGSIINDKWILTAAHCVTGLRDPLLGVRTGEHNIQSQRDCEIQSNEKNKCNSPVQDLAIEEVRPYPKFNLTIIDNDIALIKVTRMNLSVENVRPVCLPLDSNTREAVFQNAVVTGWGITDSGQSSNILQKVTLPVVTLEQCKSIYKNEPRVRITYKQLCAGGQDKKDSCSGDSGGPLQAAGYVNEETKYVQHGVVSFGPRDCGREGYPGVYTKVAYYMDWILDTIGSYNYV